MRKALEVGHEEAAAGIMGGVRAYTAFQNIKMVSGESILVLDGLNFNNNPH